MLQSVLSRKEIPEENLKSFRKSFDSGQKLLSLQYRLLINDLKEASELVKKIENSSQSSSIEFKLLQIFYLIEVEEFAKAENLLNQKLKKTDPLVFSSMHWLKYDLFKKQLKYSDCLQLLEEKTQVNQGLRPLLERVFLLCEINRRSEAISLLESFKSSSEPSSLIDLCHSYLLENFEDCLTLCDEFLKTNPNSEDCMALKALSEIKVNDLNSALQTLDEALTLNNKIKSLWTLSGIAYFRLGVFSDSFLCFSKAISLKPASASDWLNLSLIYTSKHPEVFKKIQNKVRSLSGSPSGPSVDFEFPSIDFSEFGKRKSELIVRPFKDLDCVFVRPKPKKLKKCAQKPKRQDQDIAALAFVLQGFKTKSQKFNKVDINSTSLPVKRKRRDKG